MLSCIQQTCFIFTRICVKVNDKKYIEADHETADPKGHNARLSKLICHVSVFKFLRIQSQKPIEKRLKLHFNARSSLSTLAEIVESTDLKQREKESRSLRRESLSYDDAFIVSGETTV